MSTTLITWKDSSYAETASCMLAFGSQWYLKEKGVWKVNMTK